MMRSSPRVSSIRSAETDTAVLVLGGLVLLLLLILAAGDGFMAWQGQRAQQAAREGR
jgi:uncharacterized protein HemX